MTRAYQNAGRLMRGQKFHAKPMEWNGKRYPSTAECLRAQELHLLAECLEITELQEQPRVELEPGVFFTPDFTYREGHGVRFYEDVKGADTPRFRVMAKLWFLHGPAPLRIIKRIRGKSVCVRVIAPLRVATPIGRAARAGDMTPIDQLAHEEERTMPSETPKQQRFMGAELKRKREGKKTKTGMSEKQLRDFAKGTKKKR